MRSNGNFAYFVRNLNLKHRLSLRDQHDDNEVWYMHISPLSALAGFAALVLLLFIVILTTVAYTSILDFIPGYPGNKSRELLIENTMRLDSMERELSSMQMYVDNVTLIMDGKTPVVRSVTGAVIDTLRKGNAQTVRPNAADSLLRAQIESNPRYELSEQVAGGKRASFVLMPPVKGVVATKFAPREGRFGVGVATASNQQVVAVREGTVILSVWSPNDGYLVQIQHTDNIISVYKRCAKVLHAVGMRVKEGQVLGYTGEGVSSEAGKGFFEFELWVDGSPVDPEGYMVF